MIMVRRRIFGRISLRFRDVIKGLQRIRLLCGGWAQGPSLKVGEPARGRGGNRVKLRPDAAW